MNRQTVAAVLLLIVLGVGAVFLGVSAYNAGVTAGLAQNIADTGSGVVVTPGYATAPYVGWGYGWGNGGFNFFGFLGTILVIFLIFGLIRAAFGMGRGWGRRGWGPGPGYGRGWDSHHRDAWDQRAREFHDELHRTGGGPSSGGSGEAGQPSS
jgi:hypothetical protein